MGGGRGGRGGQEAGGLGWERVGVVGGGRPDNRLPLAASMVARPPVCVMRVMCVWSRHIYECVKSLVARVLQCVAVCCSVLQRGAVCCSVLQCVAVCCSVLQCVAAC